MRFCFGQGLACVLKSRRMIIGIDASRYFHDSATGVENYSRYIIDGILKEIAKIPSDKVVLYSRDQLYIKNLPKNVENKVIKAKRLWTLRGLSGEIKKKSSRCFICSFSCFAAFFTKKECHNHPRCCV